MSLGCHGSGFRRLALEYCDTIGLLPTTFIWRSSGEVRLPNSAMVRNENCRKTRRLYDLVGATKALAQAEASGRHGNLSQIVARFYLPRVAQAGASDVPGSRRHPIIRLKGAQNRHAMASSASKSGRSSGGWSLAKRFSAGKKKNVIVRRPQVHRSLTAVQASQLDEAPAPCARSSSRRNCKHAQLRQPTRDVQRWEDQQVYFARRELPLDLGPATASEMRSDAAHEAEDAAKRHRRNEVAKDITHLYTREETWGPVWAEAAHIFMHAIDVVGAPPPPPPPSLLPHPPPRMRAHLSTLQCTARP